MFTIRAIFDGKNFFPLPNEPLPQVQGEVPVAIVFLEDVYLKQVDQARQTEVATRMRTARNLMEPLGASVKDLIEAGRER